MSKEMNGWIPLTGAVYIDREIKHSSEEIIKRCLESGIVGMGGAAFPSHVKLTSHREKMQPAYYKRC